MSQFTPEQIQEILDIFFNQFAHRQYIGARYVPIFGRKDETSIEWDGGIGTYEPLTIVLYQGNSYTSRQFVPVGVNITNNEYWANTGNYNAQVEAYRQEVFALANMLPDTEFDSVNTVKKYIDDADDVIKNIIPYDDFDSTNTVKKYIDDADDKLTFEKVQCFETIADMKAYDRLENGMICHTNGFHESGDGGGSWYEISDTGTANEMDVISCQHNMYATLIKNGTKYYISQYGAQSNENCGDILQHIFNIITNGDTIVFDVNDIIIEKQITLEKNNILLTSAMPYYHYIHTDVTGYAILINSHGCILDNLSFKNSNANDILDISNNDKCIRVIDLIYPVEGEFWNIDVTFKNCTFIYYYNCITAYGKNCNVHHCEFSNCINPIDLYEKYNGNPSDTDYQRRGLIFENNVFHGGDPTLTINKTYDQVETIAIKNDGYSRELIIRDNVFDSDYCGYIYKGTDGGIVIDGNTCEDHTGALGIAIITARSALNQSNCIITNNKLETFESKDHPQVMHPIIFNGNSTLRIADNYFYAYCTILKILGAVGQIYIANNSFFAFTNKYPDANDGVFSSEMATAAGAYLIANIFEGSTGSCKLVYASQSTFSIWNSNYQNCNAINTNHFTLPA